MVNNAVHSAGKRWNRTLFKGTFITRVLTQMEGKRILKKKKHYCRIKLQEREKLKLGKLRRLWNYECENLCWVRYSQSGRGRGIGSLGMLRSRFEKNAKALHNTLRTSTDCACVLRFVQPQPSTQAFLKSLQAPAPRGAEAPGCAGMWVLLTQDPKETSAWVHDQSRWLIFMCCLEIFEITFRCNYSIF